MIPTKFSRPFGFLLTTVSLSIFVFLSCSEKNGEEVKNAPRNFNNKTTSFIYNVISPDPNATITPQYSTSINTFSVNLLREVYNDTQAKDENIVLSPFSVSRSLSVITDAADGKSKSELLSALGGQTALDDARNALSELLYADKSIVLQCADAIWVDSLHYTLNSTFKEKANTKFGVEYRGLDFSKKNQAVTSINNWISTNTNQCLTHVVDTNSIHTNTAFFLTNAIYFKADWTSPFDITKTQIEPFYSPDGTISVKMMNSGYVHKIRKTSTYENAKIFYGTSKADYFYLDIYMPTTMSLKDFLQNSCLSALSNNDSSTIGSLKLPKFSFTSSLDLIPVLKRLGIKEIFNPDNLDLSGIVQSANSKENADIYIEQIKHVAGIETDEEGTKAYATTVIGGTSLCAATLSPIIFDKPFVYFIRAGKNGLILFAGVVNKPND